MVVSWLQKSQSCLELSLCSAVNPFIDAVACMELCRSLRREVYTDERSADFSCWFFFFPPRDLKFTKYRWFFTGIAKNTSLISITLLPNFQACSRAWSHFYISINSNNNSSSSSSSKSNIIKAAYLFAYSLSPKWLKFFCWNFPIKDQSEGDVSI